MATTTAKPTNRLDLRKLQAWDQGLVNQALVKENILPGKPTDEQVEKAEGGVVPSAGPGAQITEGTFNGTAKALTGIYKKIEARFHGLFEVAGISPSLPVKTTLEDKQNLYKWSPPGDIYPPHLDIKNGDPDNLSPLQIFNFMRLIDTQFVLASVVPQKIKDFVYSHPDQGATMSALDVQNHKLRALKRNILDKPNVGDCTVTPWYTDESFGQQQFTGANPVTIEIASANWVKQFTAEAKKQGQDQVVTLIGAAAAKKSLYVQDCSYYREAAGLGPLEDIHAKVEDASLDRFACAAVTLFYLTDEGKLHPLAIVIDYKQDMAHSVTLFNKRLDPSDRGDQATDWPWRYAKSCASAADWVRHQVKVHLVDCHLIEEATIVAGHRSFPPEHPVYKCLEPHWLKTLPLNAAARATLIPSVIVPLIGMELQNTYDFIKETYKRFDFQEHYVPHHLKKRGFPLDQLDDPKFHNYAYGREIAMMWNIIRKFVRAYFLNGKNGYTDDKVAKDEAIKMWYTEMQDPDKGNMPSFPTIKTVEQLVDAVTMCIHIASPQHTAVNYTQEYYNSYVVNKPPAICSPLPKTLQELLRYDEKALMHALPINRPNEWLLASHLVHLLSYQVAEEQNLINYAISLFHLSDDEPAIQAAARDFVYDLQGFDMDVKKIAAELDNKEIQYTVLDPDLNAVSILI